MRKVILFIATSLDGFIARNDNDISWLFHDQDYGYKKFYSGIDCVIMGRKTYEVACQLEENPFLEKKCYVFTRKKMEDENNVLYRNNPVHVATELKRKEGKNIWLVGGEQISKELMNAGLIDEIVLSIHPIILGEGIFLYGGIDQRKLQLISCSSFTSGLIQMHYLVRNNI